MNTGKKIILIICIALLISIIKASESHNKNDELLRQFAKFIQTSADKYVSPNNMINKDNYADYFHSVLQKYSYYFGQSQYLDTELLQCVKHFIENSKYEQVPKEQIFEDVGSLFEQFLTQNSNQYARILQHFYPKAVPSNQVQNIAKRRKYFDYFIRQKYPNGQQNTVSQQDYPQLLKLILLSNIDGRKVTKYIEEQLDKCLVDFVSEKLFFDRIGFQQFSSDVQSKFSQFLLANAMQYEKIIKLIYLPKSEQQKQNQSRSQTKQQKNEGLMKLQKIVSHYLNKLGKQKLDQKLYIKLIKDSLYSLLSLYKQQYPIPHIFYHCVDDFVQNMHFHPQNINAQKITQNIDGYFKQYEAKNIRKCYRLIKIMHPQTIQNKKANQVLEYRQALYYYISQYAENKNNDISKQRYPALLKQIFLRVYGLEDREKQVDLLLQMSLQQFMGTKSKIISFREMHDDIMERYQQFLVKNVDRYYKVLRKFYYSAIAKDEGKFKKYQIISIIHEELQRIEIDSDKIPKIQYCSLLQNVILKTNQKVSQTLPVLNEAIRQFIDEKDSETIDLDQLVTDFRFGFLEFLNKNKQKYGQILEEVYHNQHATIQQQNNGSDDL